MLEFMGCLWLDDGCPWDQWDRNLHGLYDGWMVVGWVFVAKKMDDLLMLGILSV